ncbi:hypothetical protein ACTXT7_003830 [Hymenolepis weldensis]
MFPLSVKTLTECCFCNDSHVTQFCVRTNHAFAICVAIEDIGKRCAQRNQPEIINKNVTERVESTANQMTESIAGSKKDTKWDENAQKNPQERATKAEWRSAFETKDECRVLFASCEVKAPNQEEGRGQVLRRNGERHDKEAESRTREQLDGWSSKT